MWMLSLHSVSFCENEALEVFLHAVFRTILPDDAANGFCPIASSSTLWRMTWQQDKQGAVFILQGCWNHAWALSRGHGRERTRFHHFESYESYLPSSQEKVAIIPILALLLLLSLAKGNKVLCSSELGCFVDTAEHLDQTMEAGIPRH